MWVCTRRYRFYVLQEKIQMNLKTQTQFDIILLTAFAVWVKVHKSKYARSSRKCLYGKRECLSKLASIIALSFFLM